MLRFLVRRFGENSALGPEPKASQPTQLFATEGERDGVGVGIRGGRRQRGKWDEGNAQEIQYPFQLRVLLVSFPSLPSSGRLFLASWRAKAHDSTAHALATAALSFYALREKIILDALNLHETNES